MARSKKNGGSGDCSGKASSSKNKVIDTSISIKKTLNDENDCELLNCPKCGNDIKTRRLYYCTACGNSYDKQKNNFSASKSPMYAGNNGYVNICKECMKKFYNSYVDLYSGDEAMATERLCQVFDWWYDERPFNSSRTISSDRPRIYDYVNKIYMNQYKKYCGDFTYTTTIKNKFKEEQSKIIENLDQVRNSETKAKLKSVKFFGSGFEDEDYVYLQSEYDDWTTRHECNTKAQEEIFKRICFKQLEILKATRKGENTKDLDKTLQDLLDTAKLTPKQNKGDVLSKAKTFSQLIDEWENEEPIPEPDPEFEDVDHIAKYIDVFFKGHLSKVLGFKNGISALYDKFISKFSAKKQEYSEDDTDEEIFNKLFGSPDEDD